MDWREPWVEIFLLRVKLMYFFLYGALSCAEGWLTIDLASRNMS